MTDHLAPEPVEIPGLTPLQARALAMTLAGESQIDIAKALDVARVTILKWSRLPEFEAQLRAFRNSVVGHARTKLALLANGAVKAYEECLEAEYLPGIDAEKRRQFTAASVRVQVASQVLDRLGVTAERAAEDVLANHRSPAELEAALRARGWVHRDDPPEEV